MINKIAGFTCIAMGFILLGMVLSGCAAKSGQETTRVGLDWKCVPSIHVQENSFGVVSGMEYNGCYYEDQYNCYMCPVDK